MQSPTINLRLRVGHFERPIPSVWTTEVQHSCIDILPRQVFESLQHQVLMETLTLHTCLT